ncbi:hypothetical protein NSPZN2_11251 [Nitrospira defluvii]|uniref:Uncharacterized protein n=1 Tax=Nitrospira defluvii TaxID=330214 RepID=A0ABM8QRS1_9BACT|nr:hypothetical protein NSPZN2_11251 [Nitrospira defluvii]
MKSGERVKRSLVCTSSVGVLPAALLENPFEQPAMVLSFSLFLPLAGETSVFPAQP